MDMEIELDFDKEYMEKYSKRQTVVSKRRYEMMKMFRKDIASKWENK